MTFWDEKARLKMEKKQTIEEMKKMFRSIAAVSNNKPPIKKRKKSQDGSRKPDSNSGS
jgi:hypothetical protein